MIFEPTLMLMFGEDLISERERHMLFDVSHSPNVINNLFLERIIIKRIHCKIAAHYILFNSSKFISYRTVCIRTESTYFKYFWTKNNMYKTEAAADYA